MKQLIGTVIVKKAELQALLLATSNIVGKDWLKSIAIEKAGSDFYLTSVFEHGFSRLKIKGYNEVLETTLVRTYLDRLVVQEVLKDAVKGATLVLKMYQHDDANKTVDVILVNENLLTGEFKGKDYSLEQKEYLLTTEYAPPNLLAMVNRYCEGINSYFTNATVEYVAYGAGHQVLDYPILETSILEIAVRQAKLLGVDFVAHATPAIALQSNERSYIREVPRGVVYSADTENTFMTFLRPKDSSINSYTPFRANVIQTTEQKV